MKINRNDPCPCGSGKKYKKCHGLADQEAKKIQRTYQLREGAENPLAAFANSIISAVDSAEKFVPSADLPESKASTEEAENPVLAPPKAQPA